MCLLECFAPFSSRNLFINKFAICTSLHIFSQWQRYQFHCFFCFEVKYIFFIDIYRRLTVVYISMNNINRRLLSLYNVYYLYKYFYYTYVQVWMLCYTMLYFKMEDILLFSTIFSLLHLIHLYLLSCIVVEEYCYC